AALKIDIQPGDLQVDFIAVAGSDSPGTGYAAFGTGLFDFRQQCLDFLDRADVEDGHGQQLFAGVAEVIDRGLVDGKDLERVSVENPHGLWIVLKQLAVLGLAVLQLMQHFHAHGNVAEENHQTALERISGDVDIDVEGSAKVFEIDGGVIPKCFLISLDG